jgi:hypothetical protein
MAPELLRCLLSQKRWKDKKIRGREDVTILQRSKIDRKALSSVDFPMQGKGERLMSKRLVAKSRSVAAIIELH